MKVYLGPVRPESLRAVIEAQARLIPQAGAEVVVWTDPFAVKDLLGTIGPSTRWVSLPVAGVDRYITAGIIDDRRVWTATKGIYGDVVAEHALALLLAAVRGVVAAARARTWGTRQGWRLRGETVAVLGTGGIGQGVATRLSAFGAACIGINRGGHATSGFTEVMPLERRLEALERSRAAVMALPLTASTSGLVGLPELEALGPEGVLVNVGRGECIDQSALVDVLVARRLGFAVLDVTDPEPLPADHPLWKLDNVVITPHLANPYRSWPWDACVVEYTDHINRNLSAYVAGQPLEGVIDLAAGY